MLIVCKILQINGLLAKYSKQKRYFVLSADPLNKYEAILRAGFVKQQYFFCFSLLL